MEWPVQLSEGQPRTRRSAKRGKDMDGHHLGCLVAVFTDYDRHIKLNCHMADSKMVEKKWHRSPAQWILAAASVLPAVTLRGVQPQTGTRGE